MNVALKLIPYFFVIFIFSSCGDNKPKKEKFIYKKKPTTEKTTPPKKSSIPASARVDLENKGVGPVTSLELDDDMDQSLVIHGKDVFKRLCTACHKPHKKFIGPAPKGILNRRTPEWVMNMILNPQEMVQKDPLAKELLIEFNGSPMANQNLTHDEARAILEYFRSLE